MIGHTDENHNEIPKKFNQVQGLLDPLCVRRPRGFATRPHSGKQRGEGLAARLRLALICAKFEDCMGYSTRTVPSANLPYMSRWSKPVNFAIKRRQTVCIHLSWMFVVSSTRRGHAALHVTYHAHAHGDDIIVFHM